MSLREFTASLQTDREMAAKVYALANDKTRKNALQAAQRNQKGPKPDDPDFDESEMTMNDWEHVVADALKKKSRSVIRKVFASTDSNQSGLLDVKEFQEALAALKIKIPQEISIKIFNAIDQDGSGTLDLDELISHCSQPKAPKVTADQKKKLAALQWQDPKRLFATWDRDGDGQVTGLEIREGLRAHGLSAEMANEIIKDLDTNEDGDIDKSEWESQFYKSRLVTVPIPEGEDFVDLHHKQPGCKIAQVEMRGITVAQLSDVVYHIKKRCGKEHWRNFDEKPIEYGMVSLYDASRYVIRPATYVRSCSYVELVAQNAQKPRWFVSHCKCSKARNARLLPRTRLKLTRLFTCLVGWGEPVVNFVATLEVHANDRDLRRDESPYWVCAYANNRKSSKNENCSFALLYVITRSALTRSRLPCSAEWDLAGEVSDDPAKSSFNKALEIVEGTIALIDQRAIVYTRIWCGYEAFITFNASKPGFLFDVYTKLEHDSYGAGRPTTAVGITDGVTASDGRGSLGAKRKEQREKDFPLDLAQKALGVQIEKSKASVEADRTHILNAIIGCQNLNAHVMKSHPKFDELNGMLVARFAAGALPSAFAARREKPFLKVLHQGIMKALLLNFDGYVLFNDVGAKRMSESLPRGLRHLEIGLNGWGNVFLKNVDYAARLKEIKILKLRYCGISRPGLVSLCKAFQNLHLETLQSLDLSCNEIEDEPMLMLFANIENRPTLEEINVSENPAREYIQEAVTNKYLNFAAQDYFDACDQSEWFFNN